MENEPKSPASLHRLVGRPEDFKIVTEREAWEDAAGYNLDNRFFVSTHINSDALVIVPISPPNVADLPQSAAE